VYKSTARRDLFRKQKHEEEDKDIRAHAIVACYKVSYRILVEYIMLIVAQHFILIIKLVDGVRMLILIYS
jgi:hypothetical protein